MIPKIIHYCWFGRGEKPKMAKKCIASWQKFMPDYEIKEWNEENFDVNMIPYTQQAYQAKKYAFVSDFARMWILYNYGGVYFDTDVELIKPIDDIIEKGPFMGYESDGTCGNIFINPGLGVAAEKGMSVYRDILDIYYNQNFIMPDCSYNPYAIVPITTDIVKKHGLDDTGEIQIVDGISIYPPDYFNPYDYLVDKLNITENTRSIHWFAKSWVSPMGLIKSRIGTICRKYLGRNFFHCNIK